LTETCFVVMIGSEVGERLARIVIESLRAFGGPLGGSAVWAFVLDGEDLSRVLPGIDGIQRFPLVLEPDVSRYPFAGKVFACAKAEEMARPGMRSLVWLSLDCLVVNPPLLFDLGPVQGAPECDVAFRPVHHRNIGSLAGEPMDDYWRGVYQALGADDTVHKVESFADGQTLRPYFNTHCFAFDPALGLGRAWWAYFRMMALNQAFQSGPCRDQLHRIFLHQVILSTLVSIQVDWSRVRVLPPVYNYPLNLLDEIPETLRAPTLNSVVNAVYEERFPWSGIAVEEPLLSWLRERMPD